MSSHGVTLFEVGDYNYGGVTMALALASLLGEDEPIVAWTSGCGVVPLRASGQFLDVLDLTEDARDVLLAQALEEGRIRQVCEFGVWRRSTLRLCRKASTPLFIFEMHLWRRDRQWIDLVRSMGAQLVLEAYPTIETDLQRLGLDKSMDGLVIVPPIVGPVPPKSKASADRTILVSCGGAQSAYLNCGDNFYPTLIAELLTRILYILGVGLNVVICCGQAMAKQLNTTGPHMPGLVLHLPRQSFLERLSHGRIFLAQPSIHTPYEAFLAGVPTILLPPQNFTQCFHQRQWSAWGLGADGANPLQLDAGIHLDPHGEEAIQEAVVQAAIRKLLGDHQMLDRLASSYATEIELVLNDRTSEILRRQSAACDRLSEMGNMDGLLAMISGAARRLDLGNPVSKRREAN
jgi:hypothetical protein